VRDSICGLKEKARPLVEPGRRRWLARDCAGRGLIHEGFGNPSANCRSCSTKARNRSAVNVSETVLESSRENEIVTVT
jgi:hypothetical protein